MYFKFIILSFFSIFLFTACSSKNDQILFGKKYEYDIPFESASLENTIEQLKLQDKKINNNLYSFYKEWSGVRYKYGGNSKNGIDCSALIQKAYKKKFNISLPRTTILQSKVGKEVSKTELSSGDLIFFKTGRNSRHVGIYIENGKFIHASTKKGVTISKLDNVYFAKHYWKSQRIID